MLINLRQLHLDNNKLISLGSGVFHALGNLDMMCLQGNSLT